MYLIIISAIVGLVALGGVIYLIARKLPHIRSLKVETITEEKESQVRDRILLERLNRAMKKNGKQLLNIFTPLGKGVKDFISKKYQGILELERKSEGKVKKNAEGQKQVEVKKVLEQAEKLVKEDKFTEAEKIYIELISYDLQNLEAYRGLAKLYFKQKEWGQAGQTYEYLVRLDFKINHDDPEEVVEDCLDLAEVYQVQGRAVEMVDVLKKALNLAPKNPKVLDLIIEGALGAKEKVLAWEMWQRLEEVNPDNQKLREYSERIADL